MKITEMFTPEVKPYERIVDIKCDLCGKSAPRPGGGQSTWGSHHGDVAEVTVEYRKGSSYPEGGDVETLSFDVCPDCFTTVLTPWFGSKGVAVRSEEYDW